LAKSDKRVAECVDQLAIHQSYFADIAQGGEAREKSVDKVLDDLHERGDRHRKDIDRLETWRKHVKERVDALTERAGELEARVNSMGDHLCSCKRTSPSLVGEGSSSSPFELEYADAPESPPVATPRENSEAIPVPAPSSDQENIPPVCCQPAPTAGTLIPIVDTADEADFKAMMVDVDAARTRELDVARTVRQRARKTLPFRRKVDVHPYRMSAGGKNVQDASYRRLLRLEKLRGGREIALGKYYVPSSDGYDSDESSGDSSSGERDEGLGSRGAAEGIVPSQRVRDGVRAACRASRRIVALGTRVQHPAD
jgi:hypothetical protein